MDGMYMIVVLWELLYYYWLLYLLCWSLGLWRDIMLIDITI